MGAVRMRAIVSGVVQGVGFRVATCAEAERLGLAGWVRNLPDGRVGTEFEGSPEAVAELRAWLAVGPPAAEVATVETVELAPTGETGFRITRPAG